MRFVVLGSGSGGNAVVVESAARRILLDAGFSARELTRRMRFVGIEPETIEAIVLTHEHSDHCRGIEGFAKHALPVWASPGTVAAGGVAASRALEGLMRTSASTRRSRWPASRSSRS